MPIIIILLLILFLIGVILYNKLVSNKYLVSEGWSDINVQLKKRYNLIPNLVETVKGYATHEQKTFEKITEARGQASSGTHSVNEQQSAEKKLGKSLINLLAIAENYPDLKANTNFLELIKKLDKIEDEIEEARQEYNKRVRNNNILLESFPANIVAKWFEFPEAMFFELEDLSEKKILKVNFK